MKRILLYLSFFLSFYGYALVSGKVEVSGMVKKVGKNEVTLKQKNGTITVPRDTILDQKSIRGKNQVKAFIDIDVFNKIIGAKYRQLASQRSEKANRKPASSEDYEHFDYD